MSKLKLKKSISYLKRDKEHWRQLLQNIDVNSIRKERVVEVVILNECLSKYFDDITKFQKHAYIYNCLDVKPIIYEEILYIITHYPVWSRPYISPDIEDMIKDACIEAKGYLQLKKPIPLEVMANLIKLRAIMLIEEDIYNEKMVKLNLLNKTMSMTLSGSCDTFVNSDDEDVDRKAENSLMYSKSEKKSEQKIFDGESTAQFTDYSDEYVDEHDTVDIFFTSCSIVLQEYIRTQKQKRNQLKRHSGSFTPLLKEGELSVPKFERFRPPWSIRFCESLRHKPEKSCVNMDSENYVGETKLLYLVLTGFYDPYLINALHKVGIPISCVISIAMDEDKPFDPTRPIDIKTLSLPSPYSVAPVYHYSMQCLYTRSKQAIKIGDLNYEDMKDQLVYHFWNTVDEICTSQHEITKDLICLICPPVDYKGKYVVPETKEYAQQCETIFDNISQLLHQLPVFRRWYGNYINCIKMIDLENIPNVVQANEMFYYNEVLDRLPSDCYTVGLAIDGLLEEVEQRYIDDKQELARKMFSNPTKNKVTRGTRKRNKLLKIRKLYNKFFSKYRFKSMPTNFASFYGKYRLTFSMPKSKLRRPARFEVFEGDLLEIKSIYYPKFEDKICSRTLYDLQKSMPYSLRKLYDAMNDVPDEPIVHSNQYHTWSSLLQLSPEEINERLQVYMFNVLKCEDKQTELGPFCGIYKYFPSSTPLDDTVLINREVGVEFQPLLTNLYEEYDESKFKWQENIEPSLFLQKFNRYRQLFKCMDYEYIPFLDSIMVRFHDKCDKFGISTETWTKILRSQVRMHDFFRTVIFQDPYALLYAYKEMSRMLSKTEQAQTALVEIGGQDMILKESSMNVIRQQFSSCPFLQDYSVEDSTDVSPSCIGPVSSIKVPQYSAEGFNLNHIQEVRGVSTVFRSLDGLKVTVEKTYLFDTKANLKLKLETKHHEAIMHIQHHKKKRFTFQILASSGARIIFSQPHTTTSYNPDAIVKVKQPRYEKQRHYFIKEYETIGFGERLSLHEIHFLDEMSLLRILNQYLPLKNCSSTETLQLLDFKKSIIFKSTTSLTDIRWRNRIPKEYSKLIKAIKKIKRNTIPHFKIISTALHKYRYIKVVPLKITIHFADGPKVLKYIPNLDTKKKIEVTKCVPLVSKNSLSHLKNSLPKNTYEWRLSLPNGLQVATEPSVEAGTRHIVQYYIPSNQNMPEEVSRTFMYNGCIQIRYRDGTIKMIGVHGRCIIGELPCNSTGLKDKKVKIKMAEPKVHWERGKIHKLMNLQKSIIRKIYRYQTKFVHIPMKNYSLNKHKRKETNHLTRSTNQLRPAIDFYISENSFQDYYTIDTATNDSHTSINDDGELTTIFADGTKITSWFIIEPEMIVVDTHGAEVWEIDPDDYTCNFLVPKVGGWINVQLYHQCEHPQYATIVSYGKHSLHIRLPDIEYQVREDGTLFVNVNDELFSYVTYNDIKVQSNYCKTCYHCCETVINVKSLWSHEEEAKDEDILLETKDTFNKVFSVDYKGTCYRNDNYITEPECKQHKVYDTQKFLIFDKHFNGKMFWDNNKLETKLIDVQQCENLNGKHYLDENGDLRVYDFIRRHYVHYPDRFLVEYRHPSPSIFKDPLQKEVRKIIYSGKRRVSVIPDCKVVLPFFTLIQDLRVKSPQELPLPNFDNIFQLEKYLHPKSLQVKPSSTDTINLKLSPLFAEVVVDNFRKLMKKIENFDVASHENIENSDKNLEQSTDDVLSFCETKECSQTNFAAIPNAIHPKQLYSKILEHKMQKPMLRVFQTRWSPKPVTSELEPPPVPKNSHASIDFQDIPELNQILEQQTLPHSEFAKTIDKYLLLNEQKLTPKTAEVTTDKTPLPEIFEWKKPVSITDTDSSIETSSKVVKKSFRSNKRDKQVYTTTPFDLFTDRNKIQDEVVQTTSTKLKSSRKEKHKKKPSVEPMWQHFDTYGKGINKSDTLMLESKHSKLMTGVQVIESYNDIYDKFKVLSKDTQKHAKRYTENTRVAGEKQVLKRTTSITELQIQKPSLPLILPVSEKKTLVHQTFAEEEYSMPTSCREIVKPMKFLSVPKTEDGVQSNTLRRLSAELTRVSSLKNIPADIEQKLRTKFFSHISRRENLRANHSSTLLSPKVSLDMVHCQFAEKECLCSNHLDGSTLSKKSDVKINNPHTSSKSNNKFIERK